MAVQKETGSRYDQLSDSLNVATARVLELEKELRAARVEERRLRAQLASTPRVAS